MADCYQMFLNYIELRRNLYSVIIMREILSCLFCLFLVAQITHASQQNSNQTGSSTDRQDSSNLRVEAPQQPQVCLQACQTEKPIEGTLNLTLLIVGVMSGLFLLGLVSVLLCTSKRIARCTKRTCRKNKLLPRLRQKYDVVSTGIISQAQFEDKCRKIVRMFQKSIQKSVFAYKPSNQQDNNFSRAHLRLWKENSFHYLIEIEGEDQVGEWLGSGSILCQSEGVFMWFTHEYNDISKQWKQDMRIFISSEITTQVISGRWFSNKEEPNESSSGPWIVSAGSNNASVSSQRLQSLSEPN